MSGDIVQVVVGTLATTASSLSVWFIKEARADKKKSSVLIETLVSLELATTRMTLMDTREKLIAKGSISIHEKETWHKIFNGYHALGGNGIVDSMNEEIDSLPIRTDSHGI